MTYLSDHESDSDHALSSEDYIRRVAMRYASPARPTMTQLYRELCAEIAALNNAAATWGAMRPAMQTPSLRTFSRRIARLDPHAVASARYGAAYARRFLRVTSTSSRADRRAVRSRFGRRAELAS